MYKSIVKTFTFIALWIFSNHIFAQNQFEQKYGTGILVVTYDSNFVLNLYSQPNVSNLEFNIRFGKDTSDIELPLKALLNKDQKHWFHPETFWNDEHIMHFVVKEQVKHWLKVIIDKNSGKTMWILQSPNVKYFKWKDYLPNTTGLELINKSDLVYKSISPIKSVATFTEKDCLKIIKIKGDWAKVRFNDEQCPKSKNKNFKGWIRWRNENELLIKYFLR